MSVVHGYKFKWSYLKIKNAHAKVEDLGFAPIFEDFEEDLGNEKVIHKEWAEGWAKNIILPYNSYVGKWIKNNLESIYKAEKDKEDSKWIKEMLETGYEFDSEGKLIENEKAKEDIPAQLCVMATGKLNGMLFINAGGAMELYDNETVSSCVPEEVTKLEKAHIIYKKKLKV